MRDADPVLDATNAMSLRSGLPFEVIACDPDLADTAAFCEAYGYELADSANTIIVVGKADPKRYVACVVLADSRLDVNGVVRRRLGVRKASFAGAEETRDLTGMLIGGVTAVGLPRDLPIWIDQRVMERDRIILGGGGRDRKLLMPPQLLLAGNAVGDSVPESDETVVVIEGLATPG